MAESKHFKFTKERLEKIEPPASDRDMYHDTETKGLKLRVSASGSRIFCVYRKPKGAQRPVKVTIGPFPEMTIDNARRKASKHLAVLLDGDDPNRAKRLDRARKITLQQCLDDYLTARSKLAPSTRANYRAMVAGREVDCERVGGHLSDWLGRKLKDINRDMVSDRHTAITAAAGPVAANNTMRVLRALFNFANGEYENEKGQGLYPENPVKRISHRRAWHPETRRSRVIRPDELTEWFSALQVLRSQQEGRKDGCATTVADYLEFVLITGLRRDDALSLRWDQVDLAGAVMHPIIHKKRNDEVMSFPLAPHVVQLLRRRHKARINDYVFPGRVPFDAEGASKRFDDPRHQIERMVELSGVKFSSHDLRRTYITAAERLDISPFALKRLCSHSVSKDVTGGYMTITVERLRNPANRIADYLLRAGGLKKSARVTRLRPVETGVQM